MASTLIGMILSIIGVISSASNPSVLGVQNTQIATPSATLSATLQIFPRLTPSQTRTKSEIFKLQAELPVKLRKADSTYEQKWSALQSQFTQVMAQKRIQNRSGAELLPYVKAVNDAFSEKLKISKEISEIDQINGLNAFNYTVTTFKDPAKKAKTQQIQSDLLTLVSLTVDTISTQSMKLTDIVVQNSIQAAQKVKIQDAAEFNTSVEVALKSIHETQLSVAELARRIYIVNTISEAEARKNMEFIVNFTFSDVSSTQALHTVSRGYVSSVIMELANSMHDPIPKGIYD